MTNILKRVKSRDDKALAETDRREPHLIWIDDDPTVDTTGLEDEVKGTLAVMVKDGSDATFFIKQGSAVDSWLRQNEAPGIKSSKFLITITDNTKIDLDTFRFQGNEDGTGGVPLDVSLLENGDFNKGADVNATAVALKAAIDADPKLSAIFSTSINGAAITLIANGAAISEFTQAEMDSLRLTYIDSSTGTGATISSSTANTVITTASFQITMTVVANLALDTFRFEGNEDGSGGIALDVSLVEGSEWARGASETAAAAALKGAIDGDALLQTIYTTAVLAGVLTLTANGSALAEFDQSEMDSLQITYTDSGSGDGADLASSTGNIVIQP